MKEEKRQAMPKKCALYARSLSPSSRDQSAKRKIADCRAAARDLGWGLAEHHIFSDEGKDSGKRIDERPGLTALLAAARGESCTFNVVIVDKLSTFSRTIDDILGIYSTLSQFGITIQVVSPSPKRKAPKTRWKKRATTNP